MTRVRKNTPGRILFVGSGPGDPALLTMDRLADFKAAVGDAVRKRERSFSAPKVTV